MTATPDPLDRLRAANPVPRPVSPPDDSTLEEILMTTTQTPAPPGDDATPATRRHLLPLILGVAAALLLVGGVVGALAGDDGDGSSGDEVAGPSSDDLSTDPGVDDGGGTVNDPAAGGIAGGSEVTSCEESFSPETLAARQFAFDGTVTAVDGDTMTFDVNEWFIGGTERSVTLDHQGYAGMLLDPNTALEPGTRALIAGDDGQVRSCGFTQLWTEASVAEWRASTGG